MYAFCFCLAAANAQTVPGPSLHVGDNALLFSLPALNEEAAMRTVSKPHVALSDFTGVQPAFPATAVVVHFVRMDEGEGQLVALGRLHRKVQNRGVRIVAIVAGAPDLASVSDWVSNLKLEYPVLNDAHGIVVSRYGIEKFPMTFVIDGSGEEASGDIVAIGNPKDDLETSLEAVLQPFLR